MSRFEFVRELNYVIQECIETGSGYYEMGDVVFRTEWEEFEQGKYMVVVYFIVNGVVCFRYGIKETICID